MHIIANLSALFLLVNVSVAWGECIEFSLVDKGDRFEVVCVGVPVASEKYKQQVDPDSSTQRQPLIKKSSLLQAEVEKLKVESQKRDNAISGKRETKMLARKIPTPEEYSKRKSDEMKKQLIYRMLYRK